MENVNSDFYKTLSSPERIVKFGNLENYFIPSLDEMITLSIPFPPFKMFKNNREMRGPENVERSLQNPDQISSRCNHRINELFKQLLVTVVKMSSEQIERRPISFHRETSSRHSFMSYRFVHGLVETR
jgi:hypothetical protein